jgi:hypothetical protein
MLALCGHPEQLGDLDPRGGASRGEGEPDRLGFAGVCNAVDRRKVGIGGPDTLKARTVIH